MEKLTIRLKPGQWQVINELTEALGCSTAIIIRAIVSDFLTRNEEILERIICEHLETGRTLMDNQILNIEENED